MAPAGPLVYSSGRQAGALLVDSPVKSTTMRRDQQQFRWLAQRLPDSKQRRVVVLTGARQTGKTTLARRCYGDLRYLSLDDAEAREALRSVRTAAWARTVGDAVLDEAQKEPSVFEKVKFAFDEGSIRFTALLGSSRILLLDQVRETLAGRAFIYELWPLMLSELLATTDEEPAKPLFDRLLGAGADAALGDEPEVLLGDEEDLRLEAFEHLERWGGMPGLLPLGEEDRRTWLRSYQQTYLERDLTDLVQLRDLQPFRTLQRLAMLRTAQLLSYADLARDAALSPATVRRYLEYLDLSYQILRLPPFSENLTSSVVKSPKLYWVDLGLLRQVTAQWGPTTGPLFETLIVGECHKWIHTSAPEAELFFYRTRSGREVDLLVRTPAGVLGIEIKNRRRVAPSDAGNLRALAEAVGDRWLGGLVVYRGPGLRPLGAGGSIWAVPGHRLF
jgi:hypothetical protein